MRILFLNRSYYPDVEATGQLLTELCGALAEHHDVTVIAGQPNFVPTARTGLLIDRAAHEGVQILRTRNLRFSKQGLLGRAVGLFTYIVLAFWAALSFKRPDVIVVETDPPFLCVLGVLLKWWHRCSLVYYLQDLFPEVGLVTGRLRPGLLSMLLRWATQLGLRRADRVVVLGEDMRQRVLQRGTDAAKVAVVPNWADTTLLYPAKSENALRERWGLNGHFAVMYSGNLGLSQNLEQVLEAAQQLRDEHLVFLFVGEGAAKRRLMARAAEGGLKNVQFLPYQPKEQLCASLNAADLHLIPLQRGLAGYIVPSKLYGILASGTPYLAAVDGDSEVARVTRAGGTGLVVEPDSCEQFVEAIRWGLRHPEELKAMGQRGRELARQEYDRRLAAQRFEQVLQDTAGRAAQRRAAFGPR